LALVGFLGVALLACSSSKSGLDDGGLDAGNAGPDAGPDAGSDAGPDAGDAGPDSGMVSCDVHASAPSTFTDATEAWNLGKSGLQMVGNRLMAADLDGDGYPDLIVHAIYSGKRENILPSELPPGVDAGLLPDASYERLVTVLMNRPRPDGGRMFVDSTYESGVFQVRGGSTTQYRMAMLAVAGDVDNNGTLDLFSGTYVDPTQPLLDTGDRSEILLNDGTGHFALAPISAPHPGATDLWPTTGATFVDVDRDGKLDLFVGFWYADYGYSYVGVQAQLYQGAGDGTFGTVTAQSGLTTSMDGFDAGWNHRPAYGVTSCDLDGDGAPELMVSAYGRQWNLLYQNGGTGTFSEIGQPSGYAADQDLHYQDNQFFACYCTLHRSEADCAGVGTPLIVCPSPADADWAHGVDDQPWRLGGNNFTTVCRDMDGDGKADLYSAGIKHWHIGESGDPAELLLNAGQGHIISFDRLHATQSGMQVPHPTSDWNEGLITAAAVDLDNDGRPDMVVGATDYPDQFGLIFHQKPDGTFEEVGQSWGFHHACVSGLAIADFDRDGDLDIVVGSGTARDCSLIWQTNEVHLYENNASQNGRWLAVRLKGDGVTANSSAIGARVTLNAGGVAQVQELTGGYGHMAQQNDLVLFFGLGNCQTVDSIEVRWPNKALSVDTYTGIADNRLIELRQGDSTVYPVAL
jgi:enediyne biosynthesis protein E4